MRFVNNEPDQIEIRRSQNTLIVVGTGTILFGIWTMVKMLGTLFILRKETVDAFRENFEGLADYSDRMIFWVTAAVTFIIMAIAVAVRAYVGLSAISEGRGERKGTLYLILVVIMIAFSATSFGANFSSVDAPQQLGAFTSNQSISALIIEATSMIMMIQMVVSALKIRKLTRSEKHAEE